MKSSPFANIFEYKDGSLFWKKRDGLCTASFNNRYAGKKAGYINKDLGYVMVCVNYKMIYAHRIIWEMHFGPIPDKMQIDHIDGIRINNNISNLRLVLQSQNAKNQKLPITNKSGFSGVSWEKRRKKWKAQLRYNGKNNWLGDFLNKDDAINAVRHARLKHGFHQNHGSLR